MKQLFTLIMIMLSATAFSQTMIQAETFPTNKFNSTAQGGQSGSYIGTLNGWALKSSANSIIEIDDAPGSSTTEALRFAAGANGTNNNPRVDTATSPNIDISGGSCVVSSMSFQFNWYVDVGVTANYEVNLQFSGNGGSTWNTVWTNTNLPTEKEWNTVVVSGGIPNTNSYWGTDFRFRFTARRSSGSSARDIWFDDIQIFATSVGPAVPYFSGTPVLVQGTDLQPGAVYLYQDVITVPETLDALIKIEIDSNAHVTVFDNNAVNPGRFQPRVANDGTLGSGSETSDKGWVQFSITFIKDNSYQENNTSTDADDVFVSRSLTGLRYQHYDVDGFVNGSGSGAGHFREIGGLSNATNVFVSPPTHLIDGGYYTAGGYAWRKVLGQLSEHASVSSDPDVTFIASYGSMSVIRFRLGFDYLKGNGTEVSAQDREYATEFTCLSFAQESTLPVKLLSFTGSYRNQATTLNWETENEQNFDHFEIERSNAGAAYAFAGSKQSAANSSARQSYQYIDDLSSISGNVFYYRLKIVDKDGQVKYSNVIMIRKESKAINGIALNPNPVVNGMATVRFTATGNDEVSFKVIDMTGNVILKQQNRVYDGNNSISINNLDRLKAGVYLLQMAAGEETTSIKFNIAR